MICKRSTSRACASGSSGEGPSFLFLSQQGGFVSSQKCPSSLAIRREVRLQALRAREDVQHISGDSLCVGVSSQCSRRLGVAFYRRVCPGATEAREGCRADLALLITAGVSWTGMPLSRSLACAIISPAFSLMSAGDRSPFQAFLS